MRFVCGECGSTNATATGCNVCSGPTFDLDTPLGRQQMAEYRALCTSRDVGTVGVWVPLIWIVAGIPVYGAIWYGLRHVWPEVDKAVVSLLTALAEGAVLGLAYLVYHLRKTHAQRALDRVFQPIGRGLIAFAKQAWPWIGLGAFFAALVEGIDWRDVVVACLLLGIAAGLLERQAGTAAAVVASGLAFASWIVHRRADPSIAGMWPFAQAGLVSVALSLVVAAPRLPLTPFEDRRIRVPAAPVVLGIVGLEVFLLALLTPGFRFSVVGVSVVVGIAVGIAIRVANRGRRGEATAASR